MKKLSLFWQLARPFWLSRQRIPAVLLLLSVLTLSLSSVWFSVQINQWNGDFFNALQQLDEKALYSLLQFFAGLIAAFILVMVYADYLKKKLIIDWRQWMTDQICQKWLSQQSSHYHLQLRQTEPDNPDQRIAEDIDLFIQSSLDLLLSFLRSVVTLGSFLAILWQLSGPLSFNLGGSELTIPGYMVWACIGYTLIGTIITHLIGKPLQQLNFNQQKREADFRTALIQRRQHSAAIAGQKGECQEHVSLGNSFSAVIKNWYQLMHCERNLAFFTVGYAQVSMLAPIFFALPKFLSGALQLGGLMQIKMAFMQVSSALSWLIYAYQDIAKWSATVDRLSKFVTAMDELPEPKTPLHPVEKDVALSSQINLNLPDGEPLILDQQMQLNYGTLSLLRGRSGIGKSTLLSSLCGFWPHYRGNIQRTDSVLWIPQQLYLPTAELASLLCYPADPRDFSRVQLSQVLGQIGLPHLRKALYHKDNWQQRLSGGEQQRIMFARILLNKPALVMMDETTSSLDLASASALLKLIKTELTDSAILFVSHQPELEYLADRVIVIGDQ